MVTKKTRLMSALMAIIMLVTLFTGIVLPVSAVTNDYSMPEAPKKLTAYKDRASNPKATDYAITDAADWLSVIADSNKQTAHDTHTGVPTDFETFEGITLWLTNDIDFTDVNFDVDGDEVVGREEFVVSYYAATSYRFRGTIQGQGYAFVNLDLDWTGSTGGNNYRHIGLIGSSQNAVIRDLTIDESCSFIINRTETTNNSYAEPFVGVFAAVASNPTYINCHNEADVTIVKESASTVSFSVFGRSTSGLTLIDCGNSGNITNNDGGRVTALGDWLYADSTYVFRNCYNTGVLYTTSSDNGAGLFSIGTSEKDGNVDDGTSYTVENCYLLKTADNMAQVRNGTRHAAVLADAATVLTDGSEGELAWNLNKNYAETQYGRSYFTLKDGKVTTGPKAAQTVKIIALLEGADDYALYANRNQKDITVFHPKATNKAIYTLADSTLGTVTGSSLNLNNKADSATDLTIKVIVVDVVVLEEKLAEIAAHGVQNYAKADGTLLTQDIVDQIQEKVTKGAYTEYDQVVADLQLLESYKLEEIAKTDLDKVKEIYEALSLGCFSNATVATIMQQASDAIDFAEAADDALETKESNEKLAAVIAAYEAETWVIDKLVPYKYYANHVFAAVKDWAIGDEEDWRAAVGRGAYTFDGETLTLTADIDMAADGNNDIVLPLSYGEYSSLYTGFAGTLDGAGHVFKNLYIEVTPENGSYNVALISALADTGVVKNLGLASGEVKVHWGGVDYGTASSYMSVGGIVGRSGKSKVLNCWNVAAVTLVEGTLIVTDEIKALADEAGTLDENGNCILETDVSVGGIVGRGANNLLIDGCYNIGTITGLLHASGLCDFGQNRVKVYNSYDFGKYNVMEGGYYQAVRYNTTGSGVINAISNSYAVGGRFSSSNSLNIKNTVKNAQLLEVTASSGELAYLLNANQVKSTEKLVTYYMVDQNGNTVFATDSTKRTFRITLKDASGKILYAYANGGTQLTIGGNTFTVTADKVVTVSGSLAHTHTERVFTNVFNLGYHPWSHVTRCDYAIEVEGVTAYCTREKDELASCSTTNSIIESSIGEDYAHEAMESCSVCGGYRKEYHGITFITEKVTTDPTCTEPGKTTYSCRSCGVLDVKDIPEALGHDWQYTPNADHLTHKVTCNRTGCTLDEDVACTPDANGWTETITPGENNYGKKQATCDICGGTIIVQLPKLAVLKADVQLAADEKTAEVLVSLKNNIAVKALTLKVGYDQTAMSLDAVNAAAYGFNAVIDSDENGTAFITLTAASEVTDAWKDIVKLSFVMVTEEGALHIPNKGYEIKLSVEATNAAGEPVPYEKAVGNFTITQGFAYVEGDLLRDGYLDTRDAMLLMCFYLNTLPAEYENVITEDAADLDTTYNNVDLGDGTNTGRINIYDVIHLLRILNGWG